MPEGDPRRELARRNVRLALMHAALAASLLLAFFLVQAHR